MVDQGRSTTSFVGWSARLEYEPTCFDFYHALRCIDAQDPSTPPIGCSRRFAEDPIRLGQNAYMRFAPSTLARFEQPLTPGKPRLTVNFFGLLGPNGPLPIHLTEHTYDRIHNHRDVTFARFLDIFHHRFLLLFYRAWSVAQPTTSLDRPLLDRFGIYVASTYGCGMSSMRNRDSVPDFAKRYFSGLLAGQTRHKQGLCIILGGFFDIPVQVEEFSGHWLRIPASEQWCLGLGAEDGSGILGESTLLGARIWDYQSKFRLAFGPLPFVRYQQFLPDGTSLRKAKDWVRLYLGDSMDWDLKLILRGDQVPPIRLGQSGRLGWTSWLAIDSDSNTSQYLAFPEHPADLVLMPEVM